MNIALWMFPCLLLFLASGQSVGLALAGTGGVFALLGALTNDFTLQSICGPFLRKLFSNGVDNPVLTAVPLFVFMGLVLERSGLMEQLLLVWERLLGRRRGGLALAVILVGALLAASTGVIGATVTTLTILALPPMLRAGYSPGLAAGTICASGTLGQIIPPSLVLILLADQLQTSPGALFQGAVLPGLLLVASYAGYILLRGWLTPQSAPVSAEASALGRPSLREVAAAVAPPLCLIGCVLGSIFAGLATPTEASGLGAVGAGLLAALRKRLRWADCIAAAEQTAHITAMVLFIVAGAQLFSLVFQKLHGEHAITNLLAGYELSQAGFFYLVMLVVFLLGCFLDFLEICFIVVPVLVPLMHGLGMDSAQDKAFLAVLLALNLQSSFLTPPFGFALFYLQGANKGQIPTLALYRGVVPFVILQWLVITLVWFNPQLVWALIPN